MLRTRFLQSCKTAIGLTILLFTGHILADGAGILPYRTDAQGITYFLLGEEPNRGWGDFGGLQDPADNRDERRTAAREFNEETMFMFSLGKTLPQGGQLTMNELVEVYKKNTPNGRTRNVQGIDAIYALLTPVTPFLQRTSITQRGNRFTYTMFIAPVTAMPFSQTTARELLHQRRTLSRQIHGAEPKDFAWVRKRDLYHAVDDTTIPSNTVFVDTIHGKKIHLAEPFVNTLRNADNTPGAPRTSIRAVMP